MVLWRHPSMAGPVTGLQPAADGPLCGQVSLTRSVLITTGVSYRRLDAPGLDSLPGAGVFHGATASEAAAFAREHLFIAGGANSAGQAAVNQAHIMTGSGSHPLPCPNCRRPRISVLRACYHRCVTTPVTLRGWYHVVCPGHSPYSCGKRPRSSIRPSSPPLRSRGGASKKGPGRRRRCALDCWVPAAAGVPGSGSGRCARVW